MKLKLIHLRVLFVAYVFLFVNQSVFAQLNNQFISDRIEVNEEDSNRFGLSVQAFNYMRNTEYFNDIELGRTLFGYQLNPSFYIQPNKHVKLQAGVFLRYDFGGNNPYTQVVPTFTLKIRKRNTSVTFGTLEGALSHRLIEPLYDINSAIIRRIENGFQVRNESENGFFDLWINWERFIERGSPYKEQLSAGLNYTPVLIQNDEGFKISVPLQGTVFHRGGQIDTDTSNMIVVFNGAAGIEFSKEWKGAFIDQVKLSGISAVYQEKTNSGYFPFRNGQGFMGNLFFSLPVFDIMFTYWDANNFIAPRGTTIYQSVSIDKPGFTEAHRQLLFVRFLYDKEIYKNLYLVARIEPFYDFGSGKTDYSYSLYLTYRQNFNLGKLKR